MRFVVISIDDDDGWWRWDHVIADNADAAMNWVEKNIGASDIEAFSVDDLHNAANALDKMSEQSIREDMAKHEAKLKHQAATQQATTPATMSAKFDYKVGQKYFTANGRIATIHNHSGGYARGYVSGYASGCEYRFDWDGEGIVHDCSNTTNLLYAAFNLDRLCESDEESSQTATVKINRSCKLLRTVKSHMPAIMLDSESYAESVGGVVFSRFKYTYAVKSNSWVIFTTIVSGDTINDFLEEIPENDVNIVMIEHNDDDDETNKLPYCTKFTYVIKENDSWKLESLKVFKNLKEWSII